MPNSFAPMEIGNTNEATEHEMEKYEGDLQVSFSADDLQGIYHPWRYSLIIKLLGKRIQHQYLKRKVQDIWKITESFPLIDLGADYYIVKFNSEENMARALQEGSWFINGCYLSIQR